MSLSYELAHNLAHALTHYDKSAGNFFALGRESGSWTL